MTRRIVSMVTSQVSVELARACLGLRVSIAAGEGVGDPVDGFLRRALCLLDTPFVFDRPAAIGMNCRCRPDGPRTEHEGTSCWSCFPSEQSPAGWCRGPIREGASTPTEHSQSDGAEARVTCFLQTCFRRALGEAIALGGLGQTCGRSVQDVGGVSINTSTSMSGPM